MSRLDETQRAALERECDSDFFVASGKGGQHRNRTKSGVRLHHRPSGIIVTATERRSQAQNLEAAYQRLAAKLEARSRPRKTRKKTRPSGASRRRRIEAKRQRSLVKGLRGRPVGHDD